MNDIKHDVLNEIRNNVSLFKPVNNIQYRIRCPICGDSQKNIEDAHCYIKCSYDLNEPLLYHCFLCNSSGIVNKYFLDKLGVKSKYISQLDNTKHNTITRIKNNNIDIITGEPKRSKQTNYIEERLGSGFTISDYNKFKIIWDMNNIFQYINSNRVRNAIPNNIDSVTFLSDDKCTLLTRSFTDDNGRWNKLRIIPGESQSFYTIKSMINLFTDKIITVNIAEGVFDVLSIYKNFTDDYSNSAFVAVLGSDYIAGLKYMIAKGFIGNNINVKIYIDSNIDERALIKDLKQYKWLFNQISVLRNIKGKDVGVRIEDIQLSEHIVGGKSIGRNI